MEHKRQEAYIHKHNTNAFAQKIGGGGSGSSSSSSSSTIHV